MCPKVLSRSLDQLICEEIARVYTSEKPNSCFTCSKSFVKAADLQIYLRVHIGEKTFSYFFCTKSYSQLCILQENLRVHTGEKPNSCYYCRKSFYRKRNWNRLTKKDTEVKTVQLISVNQVVNSFMSSAKTFNISTKNSHCWETVYLHRI